MYTQLDSQLNFDFDENYPMISPNYPTQFFSVVWEGKLLAPSTETYRLTIDAHNTSMVEFIVNG